MTPKSVLMAVSSVTLLAACSAFPTQRGFQQMMDSYVGESVSSLVSNMGPPHSEYTLPDGSKVLSYFWASSMQLGGYTQYQPVTSNTYGTVTSGTRTGTYTANTTSYQAVQTPVTTIPLSCTANVTVDPQGIVRMWQANGNHCVASERR